MSTSVKYVRPVRISTTPYEVAATIFEEDDQQPQSSNCSALPPLPPTTRSRIVSSASKTNSAPQTIEISGAGASGGSGGATPTIDLNKTQHASLQLPNNMGTISIVIESLKI